jgi:hypothetical protein
MTKQKTMFLNKFINAKLLNPFNKNKTISYKL